MERTKIVNIRFDLTDECDAAIYRCLTDSAQRAGRRALGRQAKYLASFMLGVRGADAIQYTGLTEIPHFDPEVDKRLHDLDAQMDALACRVRSMSSRRDSPAPVLRLVPAGEQSVPDQSA